MIYVRKSKYAVDYSTLRAMSTSEIKQYIRGASKTLQSKVKRLNMSPYAKYSPTLELYNKTTKAGRVFEGGFGTSKKTKAQLNMMANYLNTLLSTIDTPKKLEHVGKTSDILDKIFDFDTSYADSKDTFDALLQDDLDVVMKYVSNNINEWIAYIGSDGVGDVFNVREYGDTVEQYRDLLRQIKLDTAHKKMKEKGAELWFKRQQAIDAGVKQPTGIKTMRYKGKFKK